MKVFILEDNVSVRDNVRACLKTHFPDLEIAGEAGSLREARNWLKNNQPDLLLLDVELPDGLAFDVLEELRQAGRLQCDVIFLSSFPYVSYLRRALDFLALKYLDKPLKCQELQAEVEKARQQRHNLEVFLQQIGGLLDHVHPSRPLSPALFSNKIPVPKPGGVIEMVPVDDILYFSSCQDSSMSEVHLKSQERFLPCNHSIGKLSQLLLPEHGFFKIHQSRIINLAALQRYRHQEHSVTLTNGEVLGASWREGAKLKDFLIGAGLLPEEKRADENGLLNWLWRLMRRG